MREHHAHVDCPFCALVLEHHGDRPRLPEALECHMDVKHSAVAGSRTARRRVLRAAVADLQVAAWNLLAAHQPKSWRHG